MNLKDYSGERDVKSPIFTLVNRSHSWEKGRFVKFPYSDVNFKTNDYRTAIKEFIRLYIGLINSM
ncbi:uncharacterized protein METZ01_LOCUS129304 [marine metagenome]|jgi:hypothetical protein|uniref:Uncharacterized protein n=1 Tax=marine metagenome TaxID=408172 RepID=A0A381YHP0_9ZZZZ